MTQRNSQVQFAQPDITGCVSDRLVPIRAKITVETHCALVAESRAFGRTMAEVACQVLDAWAKKELTKLAALQSVKSSRIKLGKDP